GSGVRTSAIEVQATDFNGAFATVSRERGGALLVLPDPMFREQHRPILGLAAKNRLPTMYWSREFVDAGGLMSYGASAPDVFRQAAVLVDKILKGANPADLPIEQPAKLELAINVGAAKKLGLTIPQSLLLRADHIVE